VPVDTEQLVEALLEGLLLREQAGRRPEQLMLDLGDLAERKRDDAHRQWEAAADREKRFGKVLRQGAEARPQPSPEDEGRLDL
jgi:hypothetical protein